ncbi:MAG TPA: 5'-3' exonuclease H3TH domain-containing protein, partial [Acidobacteriaceae bacterium]
MPVDPPNPQKPAIYLLDSMAFIFRAYHAMQRQRPMSTRTGVPTAATYVFVNMINKLRRDFAPEYLAAVYDLSGPVFRVEQAAAMKTIRKFNIKTQQFDEVDYAGYKANRAEMPADLAQQLPYIRRALEAFRIPILSYEGFEADDVIGTLSCKAAEAGHRVFVVSSDKDMMQLVNDSVVILNPTKDNLILDREGVQRVLGVTPEQVIDVMALRGDAIDNIPGAPGIGDKGSVELIQKYGTVEAAMDHAGEIKGKRQRESLQQNRDTILLSKELVTIHTGVPIDFDLHGMRTQEIDADACRELFSELEFTTLLKDLAPPKVDMTPITFNTQPTESDIAALLERARKGGLALTISLDGQALAEEVADPEAADAPEPSLPENGNLFEMSAAPVEVPVVRPAEPTLVMGFAAETDHAIAVDLNLPVAVPLRAALADASIPKTVHDVKAVLRVMESAGIALADTRDDVMLYSYLVNPTHSSHKLPDVVARFTNRALHETGANCLPEAAAAVYRLAEKLRPEIAAEGTTSVYETMDLPLVPVLLRMEQAGVRIDRNVLGEMSTRLAVEMDTLGEKIFEQSGHRFNLNSPKQLGDVLFNKMLLPKPLRSGKG